MHDDTRNREAGKLFKQWREHLQDIRRAINSLPTESPAGRLKRGWKVDLRELLVILKVRR